MNIELYDKIKKLYLKYHKEKTWNHVNNVAKEAKKLAIQYHLDIEKCIFKVQVNTIGCCSKHITVQFSSVTYIYPGLAIKNKLYRWDHIYIRFSVFIKRLAQKFSIRLILVCLKLVYFFGYISFPTERV